MAQPPSRPPDIERLLRDLPRSEDALVTYARSLVEQGERRAARRVLERALGVVSSAKMRLALCETLVAEGMWESCMQHIDVLLRQSPEDGALHYFMGQVLLGMGDPGRARERFARARSLGFAATPQPLGSVPALTLPESDDSTGSLAVGSVSESQALLPETSLVSYEPYQRLANLWNAVSPQASASGAELKADSALPASPDDSLSEHARTQHLMLGRPSQAAHHLMEDPSDEWGSAGTPRPASPAKGSAPPASRPMPPGSGSRAAMAPPGPNPLRPQPLPARGALPAASDIGGEVVAYATVSARVSSEPEPAGKPPLPKGRPIVAPPRARVEPPLALPLDRGTPTPEPTEGRRWLDEPALGAGFRPGLTDPAPTPPSPVAVAGGWRSMTLFARAEEGKQSSRLHKQAIIGLVLFVATLVGGQLAWSYNDYEGLKGVHTHAADLALAGQYPEAVTALVRVDEVLTADDGALAHLLRKTGAWMPGAQAWSTAGLYRQLALQAALLASVLEYRYEYATSRGAERRVEELMASASAAEPELAAARIWNKLAQGQWENAAELADTELLAHRHAPHVLEAAAEARLALESWGEASRLLHELQQRATPSSNLTVLKARLPASMTGAGAELQAQLTRQAASGHVASQLELARLMAEGGQQVREAQDLANQVLQRAPGSVSPMEQARAQVTLGLLAHGQGRRQEAEGQLQGALERLPTRAEFYAPLAHALIDQGRWEDAQAILVRGQTATGGQRLLRVAQARLHWLTGYAIQASQALEEMKWRGDRANHVLGWALLDLEQPVKAREAFDLLAQSPVAGEEAQALGMLGRVVSGANDQATALEELERLAATSTKAGVLRAATHARLTLAQRSTDYDEQHRHLLAALKRADAAYPLAPDDSLVRHDRCRVLVQLRDRARTEEVCQFARASNAQYLPGMVTLSRWHLLRGQTAQALAILEPLRKSHPLDVPTSLTLARAYLQAHRPDEARVQLDAWLGGAEQDRTEIALLEGMVLASRGQHTRALGYFQRVWERTASGAEAGVHYGRSLMETGQLDQAERVLRRAASHPLWGGSAWLALSEVLRRQGRMDDAVAAAQKALGLFRAVEPERPEPSAAHVEMARAWAGSYRWDHPQVEANLGRAQAMGEGVDPSYHLARAEQALKRRRSDFEGAERELRAALRLHPRLCPALRQLAALAPESLAGLNLSLAHCPPG